MRLKSVVSVKPEYFSLFYALLLLYFFTLCGDFLNVKVSLFKFKFNNLLAVLILGYLIVARKLVFIDKIILVPFLWLFGSMCLSSIFGVHQFRSFGYVFAFLFEFLFYFVLPFNLISQCRREVVFNLYQLGFICLGCYAMTQLVLSLFGIHDPFIVQWISEGIARPHAFAYEPSYYALCISTFVMYYNAKYLLTDRGSEAPISFVSIFLVNLFLLISTSTGGFFSYFIFLFVLLFVNGWGYVKTCSMDFSGNLFRFLGMFFSLIFFVSVTSFDLISEYYLKFFYHGLGHGSFAERWRGIVYAWTAFRDHPILGVGIGGVGPYTYQKKTGVDPIGLDLREIELYDPTNVFSEILGSLGVVGCVGFILLARLIFKLIGRVIYSGAVAIEEKKTALALFISLIVVVGQLQFSQGLFRNYIWVHFGILCGYLVSLQRDYAKS